MALCSRVLDDHVEHLVPANSVTVEAVARAMTLEQLRALVARGESATLEFKATTGQRSDAIKTIVAMLNGRGGRVVFGVDPSGTLRGQQVADRTIELVAAEIQHIDPTVLPQVDVIPIEQGLSVIVVRVDQGPLRPYVIRGVAYKRLGNTTVRMQVHEIDRMRFERMHAVERWENQPATGWSVEDLDEAEIVRTVKEAVRRGRLAESGTTDPGEIVRKLGLLSRDGQVLNAAVVLFGLPERLLPDFPQCRVRVARFRGVDRAEFDDAREFRGHAFALLAQAQQFLVDRLPVAGRVVPGLFERADDPLYPPGALREALANAFCHRDYATGGGSVGVAVYDDRVEVISTGELHFDLTVDALFRPHESLPWNPLIANVFYLRGIVEQWGRGIQQMVDLMAHAGLPTPQIEEDAGSVTVRFSAAGYVAPTRVGQDLTPLQRAILEVLAARGSLPPGEIVGDLPTRVFASRTIDPLRQTKEALSHLRSFGLVEQRGHGRGSRWSIALIEL